MASELYVHVPATYGNPWHAPLGTPEYELFGEYPRAADHLLYLHLRMVLYSKAHRLNGLLHDAHIAAIMRPASPRTAKRDALRLAEVGFIQVTDDGEYFVPAAVEWSHVRIGKRDSIPGFIRKRVYERDNYRCTECGSEDNLTLDHIIPWSKNGPDNVSNLRTLCGPCNSRKGARA